MNTNRRTIFKKLATGLAAVMGLKTAEAANIMANNSSVVMDQNVPLFSGNRVHGNMVFIAGKGAHFKGDIKEHTKHVLDEIEKELTNAGSSMDKVLKCNVYLAMNQPEENTRYDCGG